MPEKTEQKPSKTILVAEDDRFLLKALQAKLKRSGFNVIAATDGEEALAKYTEGTADLMLLDLVMPKKSGFEVLEDINKTGAKKRTPIIVLSNLGQESDIAHIKKLGVDTYLIKANYTLQQIIDLINKQLA
ncbi:response regulator [Candidatus Uhrbacteria bacterium]|nr:response regulator [Candidatus Uhrbacteria bacterium]